MLPDHQGGYFQHQHAKLEINENLLPPRELELYELARLSLLKKLSSAGISQTAME
jgi:hypothetical protein